jgi:hypothetical protein
MPTRALHISDLLTGLSGRLRVVATLAGVAMLAPCSASALPTHHRAFGLMGCTLALVPPSTQLTTGDGVALSGTLSCPIAEEAAEQTVTLYTHSVGAPGFTAGASTTTGADGSFQLASGTLTANSVVFVRAQGVRSTHLQVEVAPLVSVDALPSGAQLLIASHHTGGDSIATNTVTFSGTVTPAVPGTKVVLQRERPGTAGTWQRIAFGELDAEGHYSIVHTFHIPGDATVRVIVRGHGISLGASESRTYVISHASHSHVSASVAPSKSS